MTALLEFRVRKTDGTSVQAARAALDQLHGYGVDGPFMVVVQPDSSGELWIVRAERVVTVAGVTYPADSDATSPPPSPRV